MKSLHVILLVLLLAIPRFIFLEQDAPAYMISGLSQEDEPYYCVGGVNRFLRDEGRTFELNKKASLEALQIINTPTTYLSLKIFGNNYYGLRIPVVLCSILITLLLALFANRQGFSKLSMLVVIVFLSTEFYSFLFGRFYNPQIFCMLFIGLICTLIFSKKYSETKIAALVGFLCAFMVFGVYIYTLYVAIAVFIWYLFQAISNKKSKPILSLMSGVGIALGLWALYFYCFNIDFKELMKNILAHGGGAEESVKSQALSTIKKISLPFTQIISTNFFRYNLYLLGVFVLLIYYSIATFKTKPASQLFVFIVVMFLVQNFFVQSYPFKKHVIFYPVLIVFSIVSAKDIFNWMKQSLRATESVILALLSLVFVYYCDKLNNSEAYWAGFNYGYYENISITHRVTSLVIASLFIVFLFSYKYISTYKKVFSYAFVLCLLPSLILVIQHFFINKTFYIKNALTEMRKEIEHKYVMQEFSHSFQFYSNSVPLLSNYDRPLKAKTNFKQLYEKTQAYAIVKSFRNGKKDKNWNQQSGADVVYNYMNFTFIAKYPLRYYDYYLLKFKN